MQAYNHNEIEKKWQKKWEESGLHTTKEGGDKKFYILDMFPYPSGEGLHVGHPKGYIATDVYSRLKRMNGYDVLHPMGFDAFGLPAEQFALKHKVNPNISTAKNVARYKEQLQMLGLDYDWDKEVNTTDPKFYKWTQWMWKQMYKKGLAYESYDPINWCPSCKTGLANEDLENGLCERCGSVVEKKPLRQWTIRITDYADRLLTDLDKLDWEPHIKEAQRNWIGKSEGSEIDFPLVNFPYEDKLTVFTTRADTMYGATFMAISTEVAERWIEKGWSPTEEVRMMIEEIKTDAKKQDFSFKELPEKKGVNTGIMAKNPVNGEEIPVYVANYILSGYGTGAIMAVPAHDARDNEFAKKYKLAVKEVVSKKFVLTGDDAERDGVETLVRNIVDPILRDEHGNFFLIKEKEGNHVHFAGGGVDDGEDAIDALRREIIEETGFTDFRIEKKISPTISCWGYRHTKAKNQRSVGPGYEVILNSDTRIPSEVEEGRHELISCKKEDVLNTITWPHHKYLFEAYLLDSQVYEEKGILINSGEFDGLTSEEAVVKITEKVGGKLTSTYKLKDWVFARQRYWGEPFPIVFDEHHTSYAVADSELPVALPMVDEYEPTGTGESPLANIKEWVDVYGYLKDNEFVSVPSFVAEKVSNEALYINDDGGNDAYQPKKEVKERSNVACIIKHPTEDKYLISKWKKVAWNGFVTGGIEEGGTAEEAARKEVLEETGFSSLKTMKVHNFSSHGLFYHVVKNENRLAHYRLVTVELSDLSRQAVTEEEQSLSDLVWVDASEVEKMLTCFDMRALWQFYTHGKVTEEPKRVIQKFKRETNTMPQWAGSSWYYLRYIDPHNDEMFADKAKEKKWSPVDFYVGGAEHATRHLIYARFWHKFLFDIGVVSHDEPFTKLQTVGLIMAEDGRKMSKRWGNVVNPDDVVKEYGADTLRLYEMFMGPFDQAVAWSTSSMAGVNRFLERFWKLQDKISDGVELSKDTVIEVHKTIKKVGEDIEQFKFNTAISQMMILLNMLEKEVSIPKETYVHFTQLLAPFAPHITEEIWNSLGKTDSVHISVWPKYDQTKLLTDTVTLAVQIGGKMRGTIEIQRDLDDSSVIVQLKSTELYKKYVGEVEPKKVILVKNKIVNIII